MLNPSAARARSDIVRPGSRLESGPHQGEHMLQSGDIAPVFSLPDAEMESFDLASVAGKHNVVLYFYPRDKTPGCTRQAADFSDHEDEFARYDCIVIGVSPDDCLTHAEFRDQEGLSIRLLSDSDTEVCRLYNVWQEREVDGMKKMGVRRSTFVIDKQGRIRHALYDVTPRGHAAAVYELVKELEPQHAKRNHQK
jgi:thioredoxin-dependent peroxiredoxin